MKKFVSTLGYVGCFSYAPGTMGSLLTAVFVFFLPNVDIKFYLLGCLVLFGISLLSSHFYARDLGVKDPSEIVIDEAIGMALALAMVPKCFVLYLTAFLIFRFLDIVKPFPINKMQDFPGGFGIIMDDVFAGLSTVVLMKIISRFF